MKSYVYILTLSDMFHLLLNCMCSLCVQKESREANENSSKHSMGVAPAPGLPWGP